MAHSKYSYRDITYAHGHRTGDIAFLVLANRGLPFFFSGQSHPYFAVWAHKFDGREGLNLADSLSELVAVAWRTLGSEFRA